MREKPILFSTPMVAALLNTKPDTWPAEPIDPAKPWKWMTRRVIKPKTLEKFINLIWNPNENLCFSPWKPGDKLWVRETWKCIKYDNMDGDLGYGVEFKDGTRKYFEFDDNERFHQFGKFAFKNGWQSPYFMPKEAARIWLEVMGARAENLRDMSIQDMVSEGIKVNDITTKSGLIEYRVVNRFEWLWDGLNAKRGFSFESNPYVWVYELRRVER